MLRIAGNTNNVINQKYFIFLNKFNLFSIELTSKYSTGTSPIRSKYRTHKTTIRRPIWVYNVECCAANCPAIVYMQRHIKLTPHQWKIADMSQLAFTWSFNIWLGWQRGELCRHYGTLHIAHRTSHIIHRNCTNNIIVINVHV